MCRRYAALEMAKRSVRADVFNLDASVKRVMAKRKMQDELEYRINELRGLEDGWLEGFGKAPSDEGLDNLLKAFKSNYTSNSPVPYFYPTEEGNVSVEWSLEGGEFSLIVNLQTLTSHFYSEKSEEVLYLNQKVDWVILSKLLEGKDCTSFIIAMRTIDLLEKSIGELPDDDLKQIGIDHYTRLINRVRERFLKTGEASCIPKQSIESMEKQLEEINKYSFPKGSSLDKTKNLLIQELNVKSE